MIKSSEIIEVLIDDKVEKLEIDIDEDVDFYPDIRGFLLPVEKQLLYYFAKKLDKKSTIVEIGCFHGKSTYFLCKGAEKSESFVYSIDPFRLSKEDLKKKEESKFFQKLYDNKPEIESVKKSLYAFGLKNFELIKGFSEEISKTWEKKIDLLFIDGNHSYDSVKKDYLLWLPFMKKGSRILFHDSNYNYPSTINLVGLPDPSKLVEEKIRPPLWKNIFKCASLTSAILAKNI